VNKPNNSAKPACDKHLRGKKHVNNSVNNPKTKQVRALLPNNSQDIPPVIHRDIHSEDRKKPERDRAGWPKGEYSRLLADCYHLGYTWGLVSDNHPRVTITRWDDAAADEARAALGKGFSEGCKRRLHGPPAVANTDLRLDS
jgi:hypothetical protein